MKRPARRPDHRRNRLLAALDEADFAQLEPHLELVELPTAKLLYEHGQVLDRVLFPHDSVLSVVAVLQDGGIAEMTTIGREGVLGFVTAVGNQRAFGRVSVQVPGTASGIASERLKQAADASPKLRQLLLCFIQALLQQTFQVVACNALHSVEARCARWILMTHDRVGRAGLPLTHESLAEMLGVQRPTVSVVTRQLQMAGLIAQRRGIISVMDRPGLEGVACECYGTIRASFRRLLPKTYSD
jgi:CRP-like cAMP-binding protein